MIVWGKNTLSSWIFEIKWKVIFLLNDNLNMLFCGIFYMQTKIAVTWKICCCTVFVFIYASIRLPQSRLLFTSKLSYIYILWAQLLLIKRCCDSLASAKSLHGNSHSFHQQSLSSLVLSLGWASQALCRVAFIFSPSGQESRASACV